MECNVCKLPCASLNLDGTCKLCALEVVDNLKNEVQQLEYKNQQLEDEVIELKVQLKFEQKSHRHDLEAACTEAKQAETDISKRVSNLQTITEKLITRNKLLEGRIHQLEKRPILYDFHSPS